MYKFNNGVYHYTLIQSNYKRKEAIMQIDLKHQYIVDENGKKSAIIVDIKNYYDLVSYIEDLEDAKELLQAEQEATGFVTYEEFHKKLKEEGRI